MLVPVILCGGSGTRLWPLSRTLYPKQFVDLGGGRTLFKDSLERASIVARDSKPYVVTRRSHQLYVQANLLSCGKDAEILLEPCPRNTASAIAAAAFLAMQKDKDSVLLIMPSDHVIEDIQAFKAAVNDAKYLAQDGFLVTFGIEPSEPKTGFGYIKVGQRIRDNGFVVEKFVEKPDIQSAKKMLETKQYLWNSGMFLFRADKFITELQKYAPTVLDTVQKAIENGRKNDSIFELSEEQFSKSPDISVDYAVMERTRNAAVVPLKANWNDLGSWKSMYESGKKDNEKNVVEGDALLFDTTECYVKSQNRMIVTIGLKNIGLIETSDAILVTSLDKTQDVKKVVSTLKNNQRVEADIHPLVHRPWGSYECLTKGDRFQVKRIVVRVGEQLSLQKHYHRAEHWVVVQGSAEIVLDNKSILLTENQSTYIPVGMVHRLKNPGKIDLVVIEVQSGPYLGEDDIVRLEDKYQRN